MSSALSYLRSKRDDALLFAASLVISVALFMQLETGAGVSREREIDVPLAFSGLNDTMTVVRAPRTVRVIVSGSQTSLDTLNTSGVRAIVNLAGATPGPGRYLVDVSGPDPRNLTYTPSRALVELGIERSVKTAFDVQLSPVGVPPEGFTYSEAVVSPTRVTAQGPASSIESIKAVRVVLDLQNIAPRKPLELELEALDAEGRPVPLVNFEPRTVTVQPVVVYGPSKRSLLVSPVFVNQPPFGYQVVSYKVTPNQIDVTGGSQEVSKITIVKTDPIDLADVRSMRTFTVNLVFPAGVETDGQKTVEVNVVVRRS